MPSNPTGPIRRGQLISPFGVGSLVNMPGGTSIIVAGLDFWFATKNDEINYDFSEFIFEEWRLQSLLKVDHFRLPPDFRVFQKGQKIPNTNITIPTLRFPSWYFCPDKKCRNLINYPMTVRGRIECPECKKKGKKRILFQVPFVVMCEKGHLQDFPWREWVHHDSQTKCQQKLKLISTGGATLAGQRVVCECGKERSLAGITTANPSGTTYLSSNLSEGNDFLCQGTKPWLGEKIKEECNAPLRGSLRSASNLYFANVVSSIYLPRIDDRTLQKLEEILSKKTFSENILWAVDLGLKDVEAISKRLKVKFPLQLEEFNEIQIQTVIKKIFPQIFGVEGSAEDSDSSNTIVVEQNENSLREDEHKALLGNRDDIELKIEAENLEDYDSEIAKFFSRINLVKKLRETRTLTSFTRVVSENQLDYVKRQDILWNQRPPNDVWLPAYIVYGEGIFFEFDEKRLQEWENSSQPENRLKSLIKNYSAVKEKRKLKERDITPRFVLLHTFAHVLMNRLVYECGYGSAALRERLYVSQIPERKSAGVLIYTADGDSEGTMGGLVRMGKPGNLEPVIRRAIENARWCSADPVCMEMGNLKGQGPDSCNLAACHNCALVPETACEEFNRFLDRGLLIGDFENPTIGFFNAS